MPLPYRPIAAVSLVAAYAVAARARRADSTAAAAAAAAISLSTLAAAAFAAAFLVQAAAYAVYAVFVYPHLLSPLRHLPQPRAGNHALLGQFPRIRRESTGAPALDWINSVPNDGLIRYRGVFNRERLLVTSPKALADVLVTRCDDFAKPPLVRETLQRVLGVGLLLAEGDEHRAQRKQLAPAFSYRRVKDMYPVFWAKAHESVAAMAAASDETKMEIGDWASRTTLDIIGVAGVGRDFGALRDPDNELAATYGRMLHTDKGARVLSLLGLVFPRWLLHLLPVRRNADIMAANAYIKQMCRDNIAQKRGQQENEKKDAGVDLLSVALQSGRFTDDSLEAQLMTFLAAGHETTASALTWAVYQLCAHADVQDRLRREIRAHLPPLPPHQKSRAWTAADIDQLPYLNAVVSEVLRYMAPVPATMREARVDTEIQGQCVPRGTLVMLVPWAVNRSTALWGPTANAFDPERWLPGKAGSGSGSKGGPASNYAFLSFLHGPRSCIGQAFARAEIACVLAAWVGRLAFRIQDAADLDEAKLEIQGPVSSRPKKGMHVYVRVVEGW